MRGEGAAIPGGRARRRARSIVPVGLLACASATALLAAPAQAAPARVAVASTSQRAILADDAIRATVAWPRADRVTIVATTRAPAATAGGRAVATATAVAVDARTRRLAIPLTAPGRRLLAGTCGGHLITLRVRPAGRTAASAGGPSTATARRLIATNAEACTARAANGIDTSAADRCDPLDPSRCLLPWPNNHFTVRDPSTHTGRRIELARESMPRNAGGTPIDPSDYARSDGFSPGQLIVVRVPGLDTRAAFDRSGLVPVTDIAQSLEARQPLALIDAATGRRQLAFAELDVSADDPSRTALLIRPSKNLAHGHRYIVALRGLRTAAGRRIQPGRAFRLYRDRLLTDEPALERRRPQMESIFTSLSRARVDREDLYLAWDFTVASARSSTNRLLSMRDRAFNALGDRSLDDLRVEGRSPTFDVTEVRNFAGCGNDGCQAGEDANVRRRIEGTVSVPCFLDRPGCPTGARFTLSPGPYGTPVQTPGNRQVARFVCIIGRSAVNDGTVQPSRPLLFGHGLLGGAGDVDGFAVAANLARAVICGTDWRGMSREDVPTISGFLPELSGFPTLPDRVQQGMLAFLYLGRAMVHPDGFSADPAFRFDDAGGGQRSAIDTTRLFFNGNSQGGILGGALTAVAPDFQRAVLGVPAMNFSTLLQRSTQFDPFLQNILRSYPDPLERQVVLSLIQILWDRAEANGYANRMTTDPLPGTPEHAVVLLEAFGDHQVSNVATEAEARTIGARLRTPALDPGRSRDRRPFFGIPPIGAFPYTGSALVVTDSGPVRNAGGFPVGTPAAPTTNSPPRTGSDPHNSAADEIPILLLVDRFLRTDGAVVDTCSGRPCRVDGYTGSP